MKPLVCIVLLNWNQREDTLSCLESLTKIVYSPIQIVIVDNGSVDGSVDSINSNYPAVKIIKLSHNTGCAGGRNRGLAYARSLNSDFVLFLDNDTTVEPDFLSHLIDVARTDARIGILSSKILLDSDHSVCWTAGGRVNAAGTVDALHYHAPSGEVPDRIFDVDWVPGCVLLARSEVAEATGAFDESYFVYFEDIDWCVRARQRGYRIVVVPQSIVYHKVSQSSGGDYSPIKLYYWSRNRLLFLKRQSRDTARLLTMLSMVTEDITDGLGDILLMKSPRHARARWKGTLHFFLQRSGPYSV